MIQSNSSEEFLNFLCKDKKSLYSQDNPFKVKKKNHSTVRQRPSEIGIQSIPYPKLSTRDNSPSNMAGKTYMNTSFRWKNFDS